MKKEETFDIMSVVVLVIATFVGAVTAISIGQKTALEETTAQCVKYGHFEFRGFVYECHLDAESSRELKAIQNQNETT